MKKIPFGKPILGREEEEAVIEVMRSGIMAHGPKIKAFEAAFAEFTGSKHTIGVSSCTAGMHLYYFHLGLGPGDEVIVPAMTHTATAHAVELTGAKPVFVDAELTTGNIDLQQLEAAITPKTKAIAIVHYLGQPIDMNKVMDIARQHGLKVVEDCALAIGTRLGDRHAGMFGDVGVYSFYPVKHITTAEGGIIMAQDDELAHQLSIKRAFGMDKHVGERKIPGVYDIQGLGFNYRMNELQAAIGVEQIKRAKGFLEKRRFHFHQFKQALKKIDGIQVIGDEEQPGYKASHYCLVTRFSGPIAKHRDEIISALNQLGIGTSIYYPKPVPMMSYYKSKYEYKAEQFPNALSIANDSIALPVGPHLVDEDLEYIIENVTKTVQKYS